MSLKEAVLDVADQLEQEAVAVKNNVGVQAHKILARYANLLRLVVKASGEAGQVQAFNPAFSSPAAQHAKMIEEARAEFRRGDRPPAEERATRAIEVVGVDPPQMVPVAADMPSGAFTEVPGVGKCQLRSDGRLHPA